MQLDTQSIHEADRNNVEYFHPYAQLFATIFAAQMSSLGRDVEAVEYKLKSDEGFDRKFQGFLERFAKIRPCLARSYHHLSHYTEKYHSSKMAVLVRDYETILKQAHEFESEMSLHFQMEIAMRTLEEGILSRRVGWLAFFFIPLSLAATIFGTNVEIFLNASLGSLIITAVIFFVIFLLIGLTAQKGLSQWEKWLQEQVKKLVADIQSFRSRKSEVGVIPQ